MIFPSIKYVEFRKKKNPDVFLYSMLFLIAIDEITEQKHANSKWHWT